MIKAAVNIHVQTSVFALILLDKQEFNDLTKWQVYV